jgi:threonine dehydratase
MTAGGDLTVRDLYVARQRLTRYLPPTPLRFSDWLSAASGAHVSLKIESIQPTNSFKIRGALNAALHLHESGSRSPIVTASAGNHGRAIAFAAARLGLAATVFTPATAPATKKSAIRQFGAILRDDPPDYDAAEQAARDYAQASGGLYISPYNHRDVIAGAGTIALELLETAPETNVVVLPLGGGGLASGVALALKRLAPQIEIVGVEADASRAFSTSLAAGSITHIEVLPSIADGLVGNLEPGSITFEMVRRFVDRIVSVSEEQLLRAIGGLASEEHLIAEGAGAAATAAVIVGQAVSPDCHAVAILTGSNIDSATYAPIVSAHQTAKQGGEGRR